MLPTFVISLSLLQSPVLEAIQIEARLFVTRQQASDSIRQAENVQRQIADNIRESEDSLQESKRLLHEIKEKLKLIEQMDKSKK